MAKKKQKWIKEYNSLYEGNGAWMIKENDGAFTPIAIIPEPQGRKSTRQEQNAKLIEIAPELLEFAKSIVKIGKGNAPSVGYTSELIAKADELINKIKTN